MIASNHDRGNRGERVGVAVIGAGLSGLAFGGALGDRGFEVRVFDKGHCYQGSRPLGKSGIHVNWRPHELGALIIDSEIRSVDRLAGPEVSDRGADPDAACGQHR